MKKLALFLVAYFIITMIWALLWHIVWFHELYVSWGAMTRGDPIIPLGMAAIIMQGLVIGYLFPFYRGDDRSIMRGIKFNLIVGIMTYTAMGFATAAKFSIEPIWMFLAYHTVFQLIQFTLTGAALGWIYRNGEKKET